MRRVTTALALIASLALGLGGCSTRVTRVDEAGVSNPPPVPLSPQAALQLLEWSYNHKALLECTDLFTADYRFYFSPMDSAGAHYRSVPWIREDEVISTSHLFLGGSARQPPAASVRLMLDKNFVVYPDAEFVASDPQGRWHKTIRTQVVLNLRLGDGSAIDISGGTTFSLVRGDSAAIPADLIARGFGPDSTRFWIRRWDDETTDGVGPLSEISRARPLAALATQPSSARSWGWLKVLYR